MIAMVNCKVNCKSRGWLRRPGFGGAVLAAALAVALVAPAPRARAHPAHVTIAEAEWNRERGRLEVALRVRGEDLEQALAQRLRRRVPLETTPDVDRLIVDYLKEAFTVRQADDLRPLVWVGKEVTLKHTWLYFEFPLEADGQLRLGNRVFAELLERQANTILVKDGPRRASVLCTAQQPEAVAEFDKPKK